MITLVDSAPQRKYGRRELATPPEELTSKMLSAFQIRVMFMRQSNLPQDPLNAQATVNCMLAWDRGRWQQKPAVSP